MKPVCADDSVGSPHVKVGHRRDLLVKKSQPLRLAFFYLEFGKFSYIITPTNTVSYRFDSFVICNNSIIGLAVLISLNAGTGLWFSKRIRNDNHPADKTINSFQSAFSRTLVKNVKILRNKYPTEMTCVIWIVLSPFSFSHRLLYGMTIPAIPKTETVTI